MFRAQGSGGFRLGFFLLTAGKFRAYCLCFLHSKIFCVIFSRSPASAWQCRDRSGIIWHSSLPLSPSSCLRRPGVPRRTKGNSCRSVSCCGSLCGHTLAGFPNNLQVIFCLYRCVISWRAQGDFAISWGCWWDDWPSVDFPCGGQLAKGANKGREVEPWVWPEIPLLILPECVCDQEGEGWYSAISAAASALRHICALLHLRETEKLSLKWFYNLYVCFFKWSLLLVKLVRPGLTDQCFQKVTTVWSIILESSIVPSANDNSLSNFSSSLTFPKGAAVLPVVPCAREAVADVILLSLLTALQRVFCPGLLK